MIGSFGVKGVMDESNMRLPTDDKGKNLTPELSGIYSNTFGVSLTGRYQVRDSGYNAAGVTACGLYGAVLRAAWAAGEGDADSSMISPCLQGPPARLRPKILCYS